LCSARREEYSRRGERMNVDTVPLRKKKHRRNVVEDVGKKKSACGRKRIRASERGVL